MVELWVAFVGACIAAGIGYSVGYFVAKEKYD